MTVLNTRVHGAINISFVTVNVKLQHLFYVLPPIRFRILRTYIHEFILKLA